MIVTTGFPLDIPRAWARHEHYARRVLAALAVDPARTAIHWNGRRISGAELASSILCATSVFRRRGVERHWTVAVLTEPNHPAMLAVRYAAHLRGAAVVYIRSMNPRTDSVTLSEQTQIRILRETGAQLLVVDEANLERARALSENLPGQLSIVGVGVPGAEPAGETGVWVDAAIEEITVGSSVEPELADIGDYVPAARAVVAFTSGTTGEPKSISQTFRTWNAIVSAFPGTTDPASASRILAVTPLSHTVGSMLDAVLAEGGCAVLHEGFDVAHVLRAFAEQRITDAYIAVPHLYQLIERADFPDVDLSSLRRLIYSGSPAAPRRIARAFAVFGEAAIQLYGTTEAGGICSLTPQDHLEPELLGTVGRPFPWVRVEVRDPETGREAPRGQTGEIWVESATAMDGYLGDPELNERLIQDGWLRTGDLGHWDQYGYLRLVGRIGDAIKSGGLKVYPAAVEQALLAHPDVAGAAVYGVQNADRVERVHASVALRPGAVCTVDELRDHVGALLTPIHAPADFTLWNELPLNGDGKPDKPYMRSLSEADADANAGPGGAVLARETSQRSLI